ncbi:hypothetical protein [Halalkalibacter sp. APA_J-10(15)]|uniref:hypothetical protein n=1 Tax=Halalkalibacter sp. APA_J-10(15) TaxID=2933805 RepID=UPI001FF22A11|nr:hypothetical protein [Halalkalibacter sp. APA_J-10(15)]MCK0473700.1 hypothetical protein [Halalkalibacter sp. APA_J-10(15)]
MSFLRPEAFSPNGRMLIDLPDKMGFVEGSIQPINRNNLLPERWDRVGGKGGENFTVLPENGIVYTYDQRSIPYLENPSARHVGTFNNNTYFDSIDAIKNGNLEELNRIVIRNGKNELSLNEFKEIRADYIDFQSNINKTIGNIDATYGLEGKAAPWTNGTNGELLMKGGAEQIVTPINAEALEMIE